MLSENRVNEERTWSETIEVTGSRLVDKVKGFMEESATRRVIIRKPDDEVLVEIPLTAGVAVGGVMTFFAPVLAAVGALAALVAQFKVEIVRAEEEDANEAAPPVEQIEAKEEKLPA